MLSKLKVPMILKRNRYYQPGRMLMFKLAGSRTAVTFLSTIPPDSISGARLKGTSGRRI